MRGTVLFVINPIAGGRPVAPLLEALKDWARQDTPPVRHYLTKGQADEANIREIIENEKVGTLVAVGGDGTLQLAANLCRRYELLLGHIPRGSANGMAEELGLPAELPAALHRLERGQTRRCDMLCFEGQQYGFHISDLGLNAALVRHFEESGRRGFLAYASGLSQVLWQQEPFRAHLRMDGSQYAYTSLMIALANARHYGSGAALNSLGRPDDGRFEVCVLHELSFTTVTRHFLDLLDEDSPHMSLHQCRKLEVELNMAQTFQIDGEWMGPRKRLVVEVVPGCVEMIV